MGVGADSNNKAFHATDINNFLKRDPVEIYRDPLHYNDLKNTNHIVVAVDPAGGGSSAFGICSMVQQPNGSVVVCSRPSPSCSSCSSALRFPDFSGQLPSGSPSNMWCSITARKA